MHKTLASCCSLALLFGALPAQNLLSNPNFDNGGLAGWTGFGNQFAEGANPPDIDPHSGDTVCKMFGNFSGGFNVSGVFQQFPATDGDIFMMDAWSRHYSGDPMIGAGAPNDNWCVMKIAFFDAGANEISGAEQTILDGTSPTDVWIDNTAVVGTAPAGTVNVQALLLYLQPNFDGGAALFDTVLFQKLTPVVINELNYDDSSSDNFEFVELYANTTTDISSWTLNGIDGTSAGNGSLTIPAGTTLNAGEYYVISNSAGVTADLPLTGVSMENGADGVFLADAGGAVIDGVIWEFADWTNPLPAWIEGTGIYGAIQTHEHTRFNSASRIRDGYDTNSNGCDFWSAQWTPGSSNQAGAFAPNAYTNDFDGMLGDTVEADFMYSFVSGNTVDPSALAIPIPASPQGGNCSSWIDPTGGGDVNWYGSTATSDWVIEAYVHLAAVDAVGFDVDDGEAFVIGCRGTSGSFGELADVGGYNTHINCTNQSSHTGIAWMGTRTQLSSDLYLVDFNDGGGDFTILAGPINIMAGVNDGWQRLRLCALGSDVVANFGGTYGCDDGQRFTASLVSTCEGGVYISYRECLTTNPVQNGLSIDALSIAQHAAAAVTLTGTASPTSVGIPTIFTTGLPTIPNPTFAINGGNLVPSTLCALTLGFGATAGIPVPGAPSTVVLYVNPLTTNFGVADPSGNAVFPLALPCISSLSGTPLTGQMIGLDPALADPIPIGTSVALTATLGN